jgi:4-amino-4-deoxychorismate lyase
VSALALLGPPPQLVDPATPLVRADDLGLLRGESVFETLRIAGGRARLVTQHLERFARSAARVGVDLPPGWEPLVDLVTTAYVEASADSEGALRLVCTKGGVAFALATPVPATTVAQRAGVTAVTLPLGVPAGLRAEAPWLLGGVKATSYAVNMASLRVAEEAGAEDAVWVSTDGFVLEAPTSTVAVVRDGVLATPDPADVSTLPGTTMAAALTVCPVPHEVRRVSVDELAAADEVLLLSSVRGVAPVTRLDGRELGAGPVGKELAAHFEALLLES